jgi:hypothetical protein
LDSVKSAFIDAEKISHARLEFARTRRISVNPSPVAALSDYLKSEIACWGKVVQAAGLAGTQ